MLSNKTKSITLNGDSVIDGVTASHFTAVINSDNPEDMTLTSYQTDKALYKTNRVQCRKDEAEFEDEAYAIQDTMLAEARTVE